MTAQIEVQPISPDQLICGISALEIRRILKRLDGKNLPLAESAAVCEIPADEFSTIVQKLEAEDYLTLDCTAPDTPIVVIKKKAKALYDDGRKAHQGKRLLKRSKADDKLDKLLGRIRDLNNDPYYLFRISRAAVFGSYLTDKTLLGDLDIGLEFMPREPDETKFSSLLKARRHRATIELRSFPNIIEQLMEPLHECARYLKRNIQKLTITPFDELETHKFPFRLIYESNGEDFAPSPANPELLKPYVLPANLELELLSLRPTTIAGQRVEANAHVYMITKDPWHPSSTLEQTTADWVYEDKHLGTQRFTTTEVLNLAKSVTSEGDVIFHCQLEEITLYTKSTNCDRCGQVDWTIHLQPYFAPRIQCNKCRHFVDFPSKKRKRLQR